MKYKTKSYFPINKNTKVTQLLTPKGTEEVALRLLGKTKEDIQSITESLNWTTVYFK